MIRTGKTTKTHSGKFIEKGNQIEIYVLKIESRWIQLTKETLGKNNCVYVVEVWRIGKTNVGKNQCWNQCWKNTVESVFRWCLYDDENINTVEFGGGEQLVE